MMKSRTSQNRPQPFFIIRPLLIVFLLIVVRFGETAAASQCETLFEGPIEARELIRTVHNLAELQLSLDMTQAQGIQSPVVTALAADLKQKKAKLLDHLEQHQVMTSERLRERLVRHIARLQNKNTKDQENESRLRHEQKQQVKKAVIDGTRAILHRIEPGPFKAGGARDQVDVTLTKPFEMMATPTTQMIWRRVVDLAAQKFPGKYSIDADPSEFKGDTHPVETVSYNDVQDWMKALNELSQVGEPVLAELISGHQQGDVYRLPTEADWEFVVRGRGQYNDNYHFGNEVSRLEDYAWFNRNSGLQSHPVAIKNPLVIGNVEFYDMHGNVWEWVLDWHDYARSGGIDPQGPEQGVYRVLRGGGWRSSEPILRSTSRGRETPEKRDGSTGFRFVRTAR